MRIFNLKIYSLIIAMISLTSFFETSGQTPGSLDLTFNATGYTRAKLGNGSDVLAHTVPHLGGTISVGYVAEGDFFLFGVVRHNADGSLDNSFGVGGKSTTSFAEFFRAEPQAAAIQSDGKIVVVGVVQETQASSNRKYAVARFNTNGTLDTTFNGTGRILANFPSSATFSQATRVAIQPDGKIVIGGSASTAYELARYNTDGTIDTSFDGDGYFSSPSLGGISSIIIQPNGRIVTVGTLNAATQSFLIARLNTNGTADTTFDGDGNMIGVFDAAAGGNSFGASAVIQPDGKFVIAGSHRQGTSNYFVGTARINANGGFDTTFSGDGRLITAGTTSGLNVYGTSLQTDGKVLVVAEISARALVLRQTTAGVPDTTFDGDGMIAHDLSNISSSQSAFAIFQLADGKIMLGARAVNSQTSFDFTLARLETNGALDLSFDTDGRVWTDIGHSGINPPYSAFWSDGRAAFVYRGFTTVPTISAFVISAAGQLETTFGNNGRVHIPLPAGRIAGDVYAVGVQPDGKIIAGGNAETTSARDTFVVRINADGTLDTAFGTGGFVFTDFGSNSEAFQAIAVQADGKIVAGGYSVFVPQNRTDFAIARYNADGTLDTSFDGDGRLTTAISTTFNSIQHIRTLAIQPDGKIVVAGSYASSTAMARYNTDGTLDNSFDTDGKLTFPEFYTIKIHLQPNGQIVSTGIPTGGSIGVARINADGSFDNSFDGDGRLVTVVGSGAVPSAIQSQADGMIIVAGQYNSTATGQDHFLIRYNVDGSLDSALTSDSLFGTGGIARTALAGSDTITSMWLDFGGRIHVAGVIGGLPGRARYIALAPTAAHVSISGRVRTDEGNGIANAEIHLDGAVGEVRATRTGAFGYFRFDNVEVGRTYMLTINSKRYTFEPLTFNVSDEVTKLDIVATSASRSDPKK